MGSAIAPLVEPAVVQDIYASGMSSAEDIGDGNYRFTFYCNQRNISGDMERIIVSRLVLPGASAREAAMNALTMLGGVFLRDCAQCLKVGMH